MPKKAAATADAYPPTMLVFFEGSGGPQYREFPTSVTEEESYILDWSKNIDITHYEKHHTKLVGTAVRNVPFSFQTPCLS